MSSRRRLLKLGEAFVEGLRRDRPHVDIDHFGQIGGFRWRELARRDRGDDLRRRRHAVGGLIERRQLESDRLALPRRHEAVHAQANGRHIALFCHRDRLAPDRLGVVRQQTFHQQRCPIAWPARPAGRISALTLLKRHGLSLSVVAPKYAARGRGLRPRNKKPGAVSRPGGWRTFGEYAFLEDSRYASQEDSGGDLIWRSFLRFYRGIGRSAWTARVHARGGLIRNSAQLEPHCRLGLNCLC